MKNTTNTEGERFALQQSQEGDKPKGLKVVYSSFSRIDNIEAAVEKVAVIIFVGRARGSAPIVYDITEIPSNEVDNAVEAQVASLATGCKHRYELVTKVDNVYFYSVNFPK